MYTITRSNGAIMGTIQDGTIDTALTPLALPGKSYSSYGLPQNLNFVKLLEHFAGPTPPVNSIKGQLWFNTSDNTLRICPADDTTSTNSWIVVSTQSSSGTSTLGNLIVTGNIEANNIVAHGNIECDTITANTGIFNGLYASLADVETANIGNLYTRRISTGGPNITGNLIGAWSIESTFEVANTAGGNSNVALTPTGVRSTEYFYANGAPISGSFVAIGRRVDTGAGLAGGGQLNGNLTLTNTGVISLAAGTGISLSSANGNVTVGATVAANIEAIPNTLVQRDSSAFIAALGLTTGATSTGGTITGQWTLTSGSTMQATYADLAERYHADHAYEAGTVLELGGINEVTISRNELSNNVFGVVSDSYAYLLNAEAGNTDTHPPVALTGRVKVKVVGKVDKGDRLVSAGNGTARKASFHECTSFNVIGRALENKETTDVDLVLAFVSVNK
jgi:hypothetical protein